MADTVRIFVDYKSRAFRSGLGALILTGIIAIVLLAFCYEQGSIAEWGSSITVVSGVLSSLILAFIFMSSIRRTAGNN